MDKLSIFAPLQKADASQRLVYGVMTAEAPDRSGEIMDYATGKPAIQKWSESFASATGGKSLGNVRLMHGRTVIGKVVDIQFDDMAKSVSVCAKIVDDSAWSMVEEGILTGFSIGGGYAKRWPDGLHKRYTPALNELSLVDRPCLHGATFEMLKADGVTEAVALKGFEPGNDATKAYAAVLAKAADKPDRANDYLVEAREQLIKRHVEDGEVFIAGQTDADAWTFAKAADDIDGDKEDAPAEKLEKIEEVADPAAAVAEALAKAQAVVVEETPADAAGDPFADLAKLAPALVGIVTAAQNADPLYKGLYNIGWLAELMDRFACLQSCMSSEANAEHDGSGAPQKAADIVAQIGALLVSVAKEEVAEAVNSMNGVGSVEVVIAESGIMELAAKTMDLVKADLPLMEKIGARNSRTDAGRIQVIHDHACALGAGCAEGDVAEKLAKSEGEITRLTSALTEALPGIQKLGATVAAQAELLAKGDADRKALAERLANIEAQPMPAKGVLRALEKSEDDGDLKKDEPAAKPGSLQEALAKCDDPIERANIILRHAGGPVMGQGARA